MAPQLGMAVGLLCLQQYAIVDETCWHVGVTVSWCLLVAIVQLELFGCCYSKND